jgi:hypothetical protein
VDLAARRGERADLGVPELSAGEASAAHAKPARTHHYLEPVGGGGDDACPRARSLLFQVAFRVGKPPRGPARLLRSILQPPEQVRLAPLPRICPLHPLRA